MNQDTLRELRGLSEYKNMIGEDSKGNLFLGPELQAERKSVKNININLSAFVKIIMNKISEIRSEISEIRSKIHSNREFGFAYYEKLGEIEGFKRLDDEGNVRSTYADSYNPHIRY